MVKCDFVITGCDQTFHRFRIFSFFFDFLVHNRWRIGFCGQFCGIRHLFTQICLAICLTCCFWSYVVGVWFGGLKIRVFFRLTTVGFFILDRYWNCFFEASRTARVTKNIYLESRFLQFLEFQIKKFSNFSSSNSSSILKKSKYFFSKQRQKLQKSYIRCTWFCQSSSSGSFRKPASLPIKYEKTDCKLFAAAKYFFI